MNKDARKCESELFGLQNGTPLLVLVLVLVVPPDVLDAWAVVVAAVFSFRRAARALSSAACNRSLIAFSSAFSFSFSSASRITFEALFSTISIFFFLSGVGVVPSSLKLVAAMRASNVRDESNEGSGSLGTPGDGGGSIWEKRDANDLLLSTDARR